MPLCARCKKDLPQSDFSKRQLRKSKSSRHLCSICTTLASQWPPTSPSPSQQQQQQQFYPQQQQQQQQKNYPRTTNRKVVVLSSNPPLRNPFFGEEELRRGKDSPDHAMSSNQQEQEKQMQFLSRLIDLAIPIIQQRGGGTPNAESARDSHIDTMIPDDDRLQRRLRDVCLHQPAKLLWLTKPLVIGLLKGGKFINKRVKPDHPTWTEEPWPILHWLCQVSQLQFSTGYVGGGDMVALAIQAGANVHATIHNKCTATFFAVKYGNLQIVDLLLEAGARLDAKDIYGSTCFKNALEHPQVDIVERLIQRRPPTDLIESISPQGHFKATLPDFMMDNLLGSNDCISWKIKGAPKLDDYATTLLRLLQNGAMFSPNNSSLAVCFHCLSSKRVTLPPRVSSEAKKILTGLRPILFGEKLPDTLREEVQGIMAASQKARSLDTSCAVCLDAIGSRGDPVTLRCGHTFCHDCILEFGHSKAPLAAEKRCPMCRRLLCRDLLTETGRKQRESLSIFRFLGNEDAGNITRPTTRRRRGPAELSNDHLDMECQARRIRTASASRDEKIAKLLSGGTGMPPNVKLELSATCSIQLGDPHGEGRDFVLYVAPKGGPVVIPITVNSVPVLAWISTGSPLTCMSKKFVQTHGLQLTNLKSKDFIAANGASVGTVTVVKEFVFNVGGIRVSLNNAIALADTTMVVGVQLGMDFFESASWTQCCTLVTMGENEKDTSLVISDGGADMTLLKACRNNKPLLSEELRFYSRTGAMARVPLSHIHNYGDSESLSIISLKDTTRFQECDWCCRLFPTTAMIACIECGQEGRAVFYCDTTCRESALVIHRHGFV